MSRSIQTTRPLALAVALPMVLVAGLLACVAAQSKYQYEWRKPFPVNTLASPKVGTVILSEVSPSVGMRPEAVLPAFEQALGYELRQRGYAPVQLPSEILKESISEGSGLVHRGKIWSLRPKAEKLARDQAAAQGLSALIVVWLNVQSGTPISSDPILGQRKTGTTPILFGGAHLEVYSPQGAALYFSAIQFNGSEFLPSTETYRAYSLEETAATSVKSVMTGYFGGIQPYPRSN